MEKQGSVSMRASPEARDPASQFSTMPYWSRPGRPRAARRCRKGILDKTYARRSAGGRSARRNSSLGPTKECNMDPDRRHPKPRLRQHGDRFLMSLDTIERCSEFLVSKGWKTKRRNLILIHGWCGSDWVNGMVSTPDP